MSVKIKQCIVIFFKYFENNDKEMMKLYYTMLSKHTETFVIKRLHHLIETRDKTFKLPSINEIIAPHINARKENVWKMLDNHLKDCYTPMPDHIFVLKTFLDIPRNRTEYVMRKIKEDFLDHKYDEFMMFLWGDIQCPHILKELKKYNIDIKNEQKQLESACE